MKSDIEMLATNVVKVSSLVCVGLKYIHTNFEDASFQQES